MDVSEYRDLRADAGARRGGDEPTLRGTRPLRLQQLPGMVRRHGLPAWPRGATDRLRRGRYRVRAECFERAVVAIGRPRLARGRPGRNVRARIPEPLLL